MESAASQALITSTAKMLAAYSWARRWNWRSEPVRSIRTAIPGYLASKPRATRSETGKSMAAYHTTLPSFLAAAMSAGVMVDGSGAAARNGAAKVVAARAAEVLSTSLRVIACMVIICRSLPQRLNPAPLDDVQQFQRRARRPPLAALPLADRVYRHVQEPGHHRLAHSGPRTHRHYLSRRQRRHLRKRITAEHPERGLLQLGIAYCADPVEPARNL